MSKRFGFIRTQRSDSENSDPSDSDSPRRRGNRNDSINDKDNDKDDSPRSPPHTTDDVFNKVRQFKEKNVTSTPPSSIKSLPHIVPASSRTEPKPETVISPNTPSSNAIRALNTPGHSNRIHVQERVVVPATTAAETQRRASRSSENHPPKKNHDDEQDNPVEISDSDENSDSDLDLDLDRDDDHSHQRNNASSPPPPPPPSSVRAFSKSSVASNPPHNRNQIVAAQSPSLKMEEKTRSAPWSEINASRPQPVATTAGKVSSGTLEEASNTEQERLKRALTPSSRTQSGATYDDDTAAPDADPRTRRASAPAPTAFVPSTPTRVKLNVVPDKKMESIGQVKSRRPFFTTGSTINHSALPTNRPPSRINLTAKLYGAPAPPAAASAAVIERIRGEKGERGEKGDQGERGEPGLDGRSGDACPVISTTPTGHTIFAHANGSVRAQQYFLQTYTDHGAVWGETSSLFHVAEQLDHRTPPKQHHPIIMSFFSYVTLSIDLSYFPIPPDSTSFDGGRPFSDRRTQSSSSRQQPTAKLLPRPMGHFKFTVQCAPHHYRDKNDKEYRCSITSYSDKVKIANATRSSLLHKGVLVSAEVFPNTGDILKLNYPGCDQVMYLDLQVGYQSTIQLPLTEVSLESTLFQQQSTIAQPNSLRNSLADYRLYWSALVRAQYCHL